MSNALGPVTGNRLAGANKAVPKPHLCERLAQQSSRTTPHGTLTTDAQGRKSFAPNYLVSALERSQAKPHSMAHMAFQPGQRVRIYATVAELLGQEVFPFDSEDAKALSGCEGVVIADRECAALGLVLLLLASGPWAFMPAYLQHLPAAEGDDELAAMADHTCPF
ncbi:hypothetical protein [Azohydromonas lata]|uniref:hypothetical protein n=1 Tax=Azohydromonas lata TaxID=45677 RepID=UPI0008297DCB|nr:hypothetical protein [Azohydromonas lata]